MIRRRGLGSVALCTTLLLAGCSGGGPPSSDAGGPTTEPTASGSRTAADTTYQPTPADFRDVAALLVRRARAIREHDLRAFMSTVDRSNPVLVSRQRRLFTNMTGMSLTSLRYTIDKTAALVPARVAGHDPVLHPDITEFLQIAGSMDLPVTNPIHETFVRRGDRWVLGAEPAGANDVQWRPWGGPPIASLRTGPMTVIVDRSRASTLPSLTQSLHDDIAFDADRLGVAAEYQVVVDATSAGGATTFSSLSPEEAAAVTFPLIAGTSRSAEGGRRLAGLAIKVNPHNAAELTQSAPLLRHELAHYLLRSYNGSSPTWLAEGVATWIQFYPDTFSGLRVQPSLYSRLVGADRTLPSIGLFNQDPDVNYIVSQAAVAWLVSHYGMPKLLELMRAYRASFRDANTDALTTRMFRQVYGVTQQQVVAGAFGLITELQH
jgi:hypothetical protein